SDSGRCRGVIDFRRRWHAAFSRTTAQGAADAHDGGEFWSLGISCELHAGTVQGEFREAHRTETADLFADCAGSVGRRCRCEMLDERPGRGSGKAEIRLDGAE